jgi:hypothetical protein
VPFIEVIHLRNIIHRQDISDVSTGCVSDLSLGPVARAKVSLGCKQQAHRSGQQDATPQCRAMTALLTS